MTLPNYLQKKDRPKTWAEVTALLAERDRLREINSFLRQDKRELLDTLKAVSNLDYLQEHNALAKMVQVAIAKAEKVEDLERSRKEEKK